MVSGYQADAAENNYWGCLYEEKGKRGIMVNGWKDKGEKVVKLKDWNTYEILCDGDHIQIKLNGMVTADMHDSRQPVRGHRVAVAQGPAHGGLLPQHRD